MGGAFVGGGAVKGGETCEGGGALMVSALMGRPPEAGGALGPELSKGGAMSGGGGAFVGGVGGESAGPKETGGALGPGSMM